MPNPKSKHSPKCQTKPHPKAKAPPVACPDLSLRTRFSTAKLLPQFHQLLPLTLLASWLALTDKEFYLRAFTPLITLWYCVFQRLGDNHHLSGVVADARAGGADRFSPRDKPLSRRLKSEAPTPFIDAPPRLPREIFQKTLWPTAAQIASFVEAALWLALSVALVERG